MWDELLATPPISFSMTLGFSESPSLYPVEPKLASETTIILIVPHIFLGGLRIP